MKLIHTQNPSQLIKNPFKSLSTSPQFYSRRTPVFNSCNALKKGLKKLELKIISWFKKNRFEPEIFKTFSIGYFE